jgi:hypothetical protein
MTLRGRSAIENVTYFHKFAERCLVKIKILKKVVLVVRKVLVGFSAKSRGFQNTVGCLPPTQVDRFCIVLNILDIRHLNSRFFTGEIFASIRWVVMRRGRENSACPELDRFDHTHGTHGTHACVDFKGSYLENVYMLPQIYSISTLNMLIRLFLFSDFL